MGVHYPPTHAGSHVTYMIYMQRVTRNLQGTTCRVGVYNNNVNIVQRTPATAWRGGVVEETLDCRREQRAVLCIIVGSGYDRDDYDRIYTSSTNAVQRSYF